MSDDLSPPIEPGAPGRRGAEIRPFVRPGRGRRSHRCAPPPPAPSYDATLERVFADVTRREQEVARERSQAPGLLAELEQLPEGRRKLLIRNSRRFQSLALCQLLIQKSHQEGFSDPEKSWATAELAIEVAERLDGALYSPGLVHDLRAAAWSQLGNALRINAELRRADEAFILAEELLDRGSGDPLERARLLDLEASLRRAQRRLDDALRLLDIAIGTYREVGDDHQAGRAMIKRGTVLNLAGDNDRAIESLHQGLALIDVEEEPRLVLFAHHNLIHYLSESGRALEAQARLAETRRLHQRFGNDLSRLRLRWVEGKIAASLGRQAEAEEALLAAREGFVERGIGYPAATVCLDLALLYSQQGRNGELKRLAAEMHPIFRARDIHREAMAALLLFQQAVTAERVTLALVQEVRSFLDQSQDNPRLRFVPSPRTSL